MTTERQHGKIIFSCDECGEVLDTPHSDFGQALSHMKHEGWKPERAAGTWRHLCPDCQN